VREATQGCGERETKTEVNIYINLKIKGEKRQMDK
jgi:hypothetical protein